MKVPISWIKDFVDIEISIEELARQLTNNRIRKLDHGDRIAAHQLLQLSLEEPPRRWSETVPQREFTEQAMMRAAEEFGLETTYIEGERPGDEEGNILKLIEAGYDLIITVGIRLGDTVERLSKEHLDTNFVTIDYAPYPRLSNVMGILFSEDQAGFLAGALAGYMTQSNILGVVAGDQVPPVIKFLKGFANGAKHVNPKVKVLGEYIESFTDPLTE